MTRYFVPAFLPLAFASCTAEQLATVSKDGHVIVDCAKVEAGPVAREVGVLAALAIEAGHLDWPALEDIAFAAGKEVGGCAYLALTRALSTSSAPALLPEPGAASLARLSARFGDVEWK